MFDTAIRNRVVENCLAARDSLGHIPSAVVEREAVTIGRSTRTVYRWLARAADESAEAAVATMRRSTDVELDEYAGTPLGELFSLSAPFDPGSPPTDDEILVAYAEAGANIAGAYRLLTRLGRDVGSESTFRRHFAQLSAASRAFAQAGEVGLKKAMPTVRYLAPHRNHTWQMDHSELPLWCTGKGGKTFKPSMTCIIDDRSRLVMPPVLSMETPNSDTVLATIVNAAEIRHSRDAHGQIIPGGHVGGLPEILRTDNGADFTSTKVNRALKALGIEHDRIQKGQSYQNGKIEKFHDTMQIEFCATQPGYAPGRPGMRADSPYIGPDEHLLTFDDVVQYLHRWVHHYNYGRPHSALAGSTPFDVWCQDSYRPLSRIDAEELAARLLLPDPWPKPRKIQRDGVQFDSRMYQSATPLPVGTEVTVRHWPHRRDRIQVFRNDEWVGTWSLADRMSKAEQVTLMRKRREEARRARGHVKTANVKRRRAGESLSPTPDELHDAEQALAVDGVVPTGDSGSRAGSAAEARERVLADSTPFLDMAGA